MTLPISLSFPVFKGNENLYTQQAISSGHIATSGQFIDRFESKLSKRLRTHESVALNSGTSALHLGMVLLGIGPGDEVICQSFTFCASANPVVYLGAKPIFVDSERDTWNICPEILEDTILSRISKGRKPKAIVIVHLFGMPAKLKEILEISNKYDIPVLEDAAEAIGSKYQGIACGTFGQIGVFSFNGNKIVSAGGGGALISNNSILIQRAKLLSTQAREDFPFYHHLEVGYNYKMNNLSAAVGLAQLEQLDSFIKSRRLVNQRYRALLKDFPGIRFQTESADSISNYWLTAILVDKEQTGFSNEQLKTALMKKGVESRYLWKPLHTQPVFNMTPYYGGSLAENLFENGLCLPSSVDLTLQDQEMIVDVIYSKLSKIFK
ncbi:aminotransferase class I/II-fold pyridoxal phosphate-dependent enzyme [Algoriphagus sp. D3-2-R+10]|uniref:aminotransferase class I/II-fold pyridoxal phosphate-dependent enzyme n=1 Tax=Algoriphagus aurantiacus TaxID=3103948 RepID=UPI002B3E9F1D|nr:aminotransferase class I/II-fold pyridoxal phosphate-dependent enzyme [Algoriphagus sp. D3-2-R+10]MEB2778485.1 aminotransferase class I/II-fold pyridoxal phosphate-dependent enzyme [Algoriphagus sp. D3-2-R+10]